MQSWYHAVEWRALTIGSNTAIVADDGTFTYAELKQAIDARSAAWHHQGIGVNDIVAVVARNSAEFLIQVLALQRVGALPALVNWRLQPNELDHLFGLLTPKAVWADAEFAPAIDAIAAPSLGRFSNGGAPAGWMVVTATNSVDPGELPPRPVERLRRNEVFALLHTSGTTGQPKVIPVTNGPHIDGCWAAAADSMMGIGTRHQRVMPLFHLSGISGTLLAWLTGGCLYLERDFNAGRFLDRIEAERIEFTNGGPTVLRMLLDEIGRRDKAPDLSSLKEVWYGNSPITSSLLAEVIGVFGCAFRQNYGMTESQSPVTQLAPSEHRVDGPKLNTAGQAFAGWEIRVVDPDGAVQSANEPGEIQIRGENMFPGYWGNDAATAEVFDGPPMPPGLAWYRTGDIGTLDEDGFLTIMDRAKDMIISGGENIFPAEVEEVLSQHPAVDEVAVIGRPDEVWGEAVTAIVVPLDGVAIDDDEVIAFSRSRLAHFKCPTMVMFADELPRNATGKVDKKVLRSRV